MKNLVYRIGKLFLVSVSILFFACEKYLEEIPNNAIPAETAITDLGTARAAINGAYDALQNYYSADYPTLGTITADNVVFNGTLSQYLQLDQNSIPTDNVITVAAYRKIYQAVNSANAIIAALPQVIDPALSEDERNRILGEAYFIRALGYFDLARGWGGVQLQLSPTLDLDGLRGIRRSTLNETYDQVQTDLIEAERLLPVDDANTRNRAQKSTALALRARLHLYREQWAEAADFAGQVIENPKFSLVPAYQSFFTAPFLTSESVFELTFSPNDRNTFWSAWYPSSLGGSFTLKPADVIVNKLNDPQIGGARNRLLAGSEPNIYGILYNTQGVSTDPAYVIRIAELYLIRAEARTQLNDLEGALSDLNAIRNRAQVPSFYSADQQAVLLAIEEENSLEFAFEAHRWFDLVRTRRAGAVLGLTNQDYWLFPIPYSDILSDPDVEQNPGY